jgi:hypothetical protein
MSMTRRPADDLLEIARVLLLVQGSILLATTVEALIWGMAFAAAAGPSFVLSAAAASALLVARARLRADRRWSRRVVYVVEGVILITLAVDTGLAALITHASPPAVAILTRLLIPAAVVALLRGSERTTAGPTHAAIATEGVS